MTDLDPLTSSLPDPEAAVRFLTQLAEKHPSQSKRLLASRALLSDTATLVSFSPLFAATLLQNPEHIAWLGRKRMDSAVRDKQELLESLARFSLTNSQVEPHVVLARFRRRELMRIFLRDIRRLATVAEITEEISNLADAILEHALRLSRQELDNRFGSPQELDERRRTRPAEFCIVSLGKLGSKELNYSSDIDLIFVYSSEGSTSGSGAKGPVSNLEYFSKLAQSITKLVGGQGGEGSAYRVDLRLRPNGRVGPLALPLADTVRYYKTLAAPWERQVLIRSRASAGSESIFRSLFAQVEPEVFSSESTIEAALENVRRSKQKIDLAKRVVDGIDVKLGAGGIREIEFIAQALQLAYGGHDRWLRVSHTLISLSRLSERGHISHAEHTSLFAAYNFLRRLEHILQMENGLQTHLVPHDDKKLELIARRMGFDDTKAFRSAIGERMTGVNRIFKRVFTAIPGNVDDPIDGPLNDGEKSSARSEMSKEVPEDSSGEIIASLRKYAPRFAAIADAHPKILASLAGLADGGSSHDFSTILLDALQNASEFGQRLGALRKTWTRCLIEIAALDAAERLSLRECKRLQTALAEASIEAALWITRSELAKKYGIEVEIFPLAVLGLGKLGGGGMDYDSDLDLVLVYDDSSIHSSFIIHHSEFYSRAVEIFTNVLSSVTRDGSLYRVDLRLRPHGGKGQVASTRVAFTEYFRSDAAIWEMLAFVKLRAVGGDLELASAIEKETRAIIHKRAIGIDPEVLAAETRSVRDRLEKQKLGRRRTKDIDIKYGEGGLLDVYFSMRYLQLRYNVPDDFADRSTLATLDRLASHSSLITHHPSLAALRSGYEFLAALDHDLRLSVGRTSRIPASNQRALELIAERMHLASTNELFDQLTLHRLAIREAFESIIA